MAKEPLPEKLLDAFDFATELAEKEKQHEAEQRALLLSVLDALDSFARFFAHVGDITQPTTEQAANWLSTFRLIGRQLELGLQNAGVTPIPCVGQVINPELHEIVEVREGSETDEEVIIEEVQRGYDWKGQLLRRPKVNVAATHVEG